MKGVIKIAGYLFTRKKVQKRLLIGLYNKRVPVRKIERSLLKAFEGRTIFQRKFGDDW